MTANVAGKREIKRFAEKVSFADLYEELDVLTECEKGRVLKCRDLTRNESVVVKVRDKRFMRQTEKSWRIHMETLLNLPPHPNILNFLDIYEDNRAYYLVMEYLEGGDFFEFLLKESSIPEKECKRLIFDLLHALLFIHKHNLLLRDLKPENILFGPGRVLKLIDFDTISGASDTMRSRRIVGTLGYLASECYLGEYNFQTDLYALGVIFYILMDGDMPIDKNIFEDAVCDNIANTPTAQEFQRKLLSQKIDFESLPWPHFPLAKDLCSKLLANDPKLRISSAADALEHPWFASLRKSHKSS